MTNKQTEPEIITITSEFEIKLKCSENTKILLSIIRVYK